MLWQWCRAPLNPTKVAVGRWLHLMSRPFSAAQAVTGTAPTSVLTRARAKVRPHSQPCVLAEMFVSCPYGNPISLGLCGSSLDSCLRPQGSLFSILAAAWSAAPARDSGREGSAAPVCADVPALLVFSCLSITEPCKMRVITNPTLSSLGWLCCLVALRGSRGVT